VKSWAVPGFVLLSLIACDRPQAPRNAQVFGPSEAGLVLGYENPNLPEAERLNERVQLRVDATNAVEGGLDIQATLSSLHSQVPQRLFLRRGGVAVWDGKMIIQTMLPEGFPQVQAWEGKETVSRQVGRAQAEAGIPLPPGSDRIGYWVETQDKAQPDVKIRCLFVADIGLVETRIWKDGKWIQVQRLASRMFTDTPKNR